MLEWEKFISGIILYEETLNQSTTDGIPFPVLLQKRGVYVGIKVDKVLNSMLGTGVDV